MNAQPQKGSLADYLSGKDISDKIFTFRIINNYNPSPTYTTTDGRALARLGDGRVQAYAVIREKDKNDRFVRRTIRFIPGEPSIYQDEQSPDKDVPKKLTWLVFPRGVKVVSGHDNLLLKYMMSDNLNATNPNRLTDFQPVYELIDVAKIISKNMDDEESLDEAKLFCRKGDFEEVCAYARVLNVDINQLPLEIRWNLKQIAIANPDKFLAGLKDPLLKKKHHVLEAIDANYLVLNKQNNSISWASNLNNPLDVAPMGKDVIDSFVRKLTTDEGKLHYDAILDMLYPEAESSIRTAVPTKADMEAIKAQVKPVAALFIAEETDEEIEAMLEEALEKGFVVFNKPMWYEFRGKKYMKKQGFVDGLKGDKELFKLFKVEIMRNRQ